MQDISDVSITRRQMYFLGVLAYASRYNLTQPPNFERKLFQVDGINPDAVSSTEKKTPLLLAATKGHVEAIIALAEAGADFTVTSDRTDETILHSILKRGNRNQEKYQRYDVMHDKLQTASNLYVPFAI